MPSLVCGAAGVGGLSGVGESTHAEGSQARRNAFTWVFAARFLPYFSRRFLIPLFCLPSRELGVFPTPSCSPVLV